MTERSYVEGAWIAAGKTKHPNHGSRGEYSRMRVRINVEKKRNTKDGITKAEATMGTSFLSALYQRSVLSIDDSQIELPFLRQCPRYPG